jgi:putative addiction module component (TIGR02574 family)
MAVNPLTDLLKLPADDRAELAIALWESLEEVERDGVFELTDEQRRELDRRWEEHQSNPTAAIPWSEVRRRLLG